MGPSRGLQSKWNFKDDISKSTYKIALSLRTQEAPQKLTVLYMGLPMCRRQQYNLYDHITLALLYFFWVSIVYRARPVSPHQA